MKGLKFSMDTIRKICLKSVLIFVAFALSAIAIFPPHALAVEVIPSWSYGGISNPTRWGELSPDFATCELGKDQSPINITRAIKGKPAQIAFNYNPTPLVVVNNGHTIQVNYAPGSTVTINGEEYSLLQFHFHTPSEHTIEGNASAMEMHLVHRNAVGKLAVVGVMIKEGSANPLIDEIWQNIPATGKTKTVKGPVINAANLLPRDKSYFSYAGSLTTPPCSEGVKWNILTESISVSEAQINEFGNIYQVDARPVQSTNGRIIELHNS
jgi:carbonic anhydrase